MGILRFGGNNVRNSVIWIRMEVDSVEVDVASQREYIFKIMTLPNHPTKMDKVKLSAWTARSEVVT